jgi:uncharacterized protein (DUF2249 family)
MQTTIGLEPVLASWKVSEVLRRYPQLLDVLVESSPAFRQLRNPVARSIRTRLVTVGQAARIARLEPAALVQRLNRAVGLDAADDEPTTQELARTDPWLGPVAIAEELDVRPLLARGEEPFGAIMAAAGRMQPGQSLRLLASFEPAPLFAVLGKRGFRSASRQLDPDTWEVLFTRGRTPEPSTTPTPRDIPQPSRADEVRLDVRGLEPPEPMVRILQAASTLAPGQVLIVEHHRRPVYLYPRLDEQGFLHETRELGPGFVQLRIRRGSASP